MKESRDVDKPIGIRVQSEGDNDVYIRLSVMGTLFLIEQLEAALQKYAQVHAAQEDN